MYSGGNRRIYDALQTHAGDVTILPQGWGLAEPARQLIRRMPDPVSLRLRWRSHLALAPVIARCAEAALGAGRFDVLFCTYAFHALSRLRPPYPMVTAFTSDATPTIYRTSKVGQSFERKFPGGAAFDGWVERREAEVFRATDLLFWPSRWLKSEADARFGLDPAGSLVVPWGAGIDTPPEPAPRSLSRNGPVELLLVGRDWFAKGGPLVFETMQAMRARGVDARLTVIGAIPPDSQRNEHVTVLGSLDKTVPAEADRFAAAFAGAHFLFQPSYESYGFAFCEASGHGLPSLCFDVGGVPVRDGVNGHALPDHATPEDFAAVVGRYLDAPERYDALCRSSRREFLESLNWDAWGRNVARHLRARVAGLAQQRRLTGAEPPRHAHRAAAPSFVPGYGAAFQAMGLRGRQRR